MCGSRLFEDAQAVAAELREATPQSRCCGYGHCCSRGCRRNIEGQKAPNGNPSQTRTESCPTSSGQPASPKSHQQAPGSSWASCQSCGNREKTTASKAAETNLTTSVVCHPGREKVSNHGGPNDDLRLVESRTWPILGPQTPEKPALAQPDRWRGHDPADWAGPNISQHLAVFVAQSRQSWPICP